MDIESFETEFWYMSRIVKDSTKKFITPLFEKHNLTKIQACILFGLKNSEFFTIGELADNVISNQGNASTICKKMEKLGYIKRTRSNEDERVVLLTLTEAGEKKFSDLQQSIREKLQYLSGYINQEQINAVINGFAELANILRILNENDNINK